MNIYLASSWHNERQPEFLKKLEAAGYEVYDFRKDGFNWSQAGSVATVEDYMLTLQNEVSAAGFARDMQALQRCDICVLLLPCDRSAHLELGQAVGNDKLTLVVMSEDKFEPELMYLMCDAIVRTEDEALKWLAER